ncbi:MAG: cbb3-type cytochrome c oxidase subunit II [Verrucomicrobiales bacterium]
MSSFRNFVLALAAAFFVPWLCLIVIPHAKMKAQDIEVWEDKQLGTKSSYPAGTPNIFRQGQAVYAREGCALCHTQMIRPTYLGFESWRPGFGRGGTRENPVRIRETLPGDFSGERFAYLGVQRVGPDLSNAGYRHDEAWHHVHLYDPRSKRDFSVMPSFRHLYTRRKVRGQRAKDALALDGQLDPGKGFEVVPTEAARTLVGYLMTLKKDTPLPPVAGEQTQTQAPVPPAGADKVKKG